MITVLGGGGHEGIVDWDSVTCIQLDRAFDSGEIRWFGELIERMATTLEQQHDDEFWGLRDVVERDQTNFGGSASSRAIKYLLLDAVSPSLVGQGIGQVLR